MLFLKTSVKDYKFHCKRIINLSINISINLKISTFLNLSFLGYFVKHMQFLLVYLGVKKFLNILILKLADFYYLNIFLYLKRFFILL